MLEHLEILACPTTGQQLRLSNDGANLTTANGDAAYRVAEGVARLLPGHARATNEVQSFYDEKGWAQTDEGVFGETKAYVDTRAAPFAFTKRCMRRLQRHFRQGGRYLLDAGSGPIPHNELLDYGQAFSKRVCIDLSVAALKTARTKLGERGVYLQGDLTRLPLQSNCIDAVTCNHVIYQIPDAEAQAAAFRELWRVLKPGGVGVVVYWWKRAPLEWRLAKIARVFGQPPQAQFGDEIEETGPEPVHAPQSVEWFEAQAWPFRYRYEPYRAITNPFMRQHVRDDWRGRMFLDGVFALQVLAPSMCARYGAIPAILIFKD